MRDVILSGSAGFLFSCVGGFIVHRSVWKSANEQGKELDNMVRKAEDNPGISKNRELVREDSYIQPFCLHFCLHVGSKRHFLFSYSDMLMFS